MKFKSFIIGALMLLAFTGVQAQNTGTIEFALINTDTTELVSLPQGAKNIVITVVDSALAGVDTIFAFVRTGGSGNLPARYSPLAVHDLYQTTTATNVDRMIPTNGLTRSYIIPVTMILPTMDLFFVRSNESTDDNYLPRTRMVVTYSY